MRCNSCSVVVLAGSAPGERSGRRGDGRIDGIGEGALEVRADASPGTPAAAARHGDAHRVASFNLTAVPLGTPS
jgi:hypothetical protein